MVRAPRVRLTQLRRILSFSRGSRRLPVVRKQFSQSGDGVRRDAREHVAEPDKRLDAAPFAAPAQIPPNADHAVIRNIHKRSRDRSHAPSEDDGLHTADNDPAGNDPDRKGLLNSVGSSHQSVVGFAWTSFQESQTPAGICGELSRLEGEGAPRHIHVDTIYYSIVS